MAPTSIYGLLHRECERLFPDEMFADLFTDVGRRSVPPMIVAVVMVLQRIEGCSDREAVDRFCFDARWKYAAGGLDFDYPGFVHTVLVDMRARLAASAAPNRIFDAVLQVAGAAGLIGRRRVLDSTPIYDAVATMDTVTLVRSAIRSLLKAADAGLESELRVVLARDDDYTVAGKPVCDYDDPAARVEMVDALARDGAALLGVLHGREGLDKAVEQAGALLATVLGQDLDRDEAGVFRIARRVAKDRVISTVDPEARHGHKTAARGFDGYKGHIGIDPDSEIITATVVSPGNAGDAAAAEELIGDLLDEHTTDTAEIDTTAGVATAEVDTTAGVATAAEVDGAVAAVAAVAGIAVAVAATVAAVAAAGDAPAVDAAADRACVFGDNAYGTGEFQDRLDRAGIESKCKTQPPVAAGGRFAKDRFDIDLDADTVRCPAGNTTPIVRDRNGAGTAAFGTLCAGCPLREQCTTARAGRTISVGVHEGALAAARARQRDPDWIADYRGTRPKVERKIGHLMRRKHGGRRARVRGTIKIAADFSLLAAAVNLARLAVLGVASTGAGWAAAA
ncbi:MAG TPA: transposase [Actinomycetota bacterium]|nr:transposase [Actinomycetota bacterium]